MPFAPHHNSALARFQRLVIGLFSLVVFCCALGQQAAVNGRVGSRYGSPTVEAMSPRSDVSELRQRVRAERISKSGDVEHEQPPTRALPPVLSGQDWRFDGELSCYEAGGWQSLRATEPHQRLRFSPNQPRAPPAG
jgi:hypothetical protein